MKEKETSVNASGILGDDIPGKYITAGKISAKYNSICDF